MARYIAVHDYTASSEEDISFSRGEVIIVTDKSNPDWWSGRVGEEEDGPIGRFPSNVVETEEDYEHDIEDAHETRLIAIHGFQGDDEETIPVTPSRLEREFSRAVLDACPFSLESLAYARVDIAPDNDGHLAVMELELIEPSLFLTWGPHDTPDSARGLQRLVARVQRELALRHDR